MTMTMSETQLVDLVINWVRSNHRPGNSRNGAISADTDLIATGLLDSFGFIDLIVFIESQSGCKIDLTDVDPSEFCVVKGLCRITLRNQKN
jgi:acyl carrier protein